MDKVRLEYEMKRRGVTVEQLCKGIGICKASYYRKVRGETEFKQREIQRIIDFLGLDSPMGIFFAEKVS